MTARIERVTCPHCGATVTLRRFCASCGNRLQGEAPTRARWRAVPLITFVTVFAIGVLGGVGCYAGYYGLNYDLGSLPAGPFRDGERMKGICQMIFGSAMFLGCVAYLVLVLSRPHRSSQRFSGRKGRKG